MADTFTLVLENGDVVSKKIESYEKELIKELEKVTQKFASKTASIAKKNAPVGEPRMVRGRLYSGGNLKSSIKQRDVSRSLGQGYKLARTVTARGSKGNHVHLVELGTGDRTQTETKRFTGKMPAEPFMARSEAQVSGDYFEAVRKIVFKHEEF